MDGLWHGEVAKCNSGSYTSFEVVHSGSGCGQTCTLSPPPPPFFQYFTLSLWLEYNKSKTSSGTSLLGTIFPSSCFPWKLTSGREGFGQLVGNYYRKVLNHFRCYTNAWVTNLQLLLSRKSCLRESSRIRLHFTELVKGGLENHAKRWSGQNLTNQTVQANPMQVGQPDALQHNGMTNSETEMCKWK